jgi:hypothetical protein
MPGGKRNRKAENKERAAKKAKWKAANKEKWATKKREVKISMPADARTSESACQSEKAQLVFYHGTSRSSAEAMRSLGLIPRGDGGCNWPERPGRTDCIYLTTAWAPVYALHTKGSNGEGAVIELKGLDDSLLLPDEDFLFECVTLYYPDNLDENEQQRIYDKVLPEIRENLGDYASKDWLERLTRKYDGKVDSWAEQFAKLPGWRASLAGLGTCAFKGNLPASHIARIAFFSRNDYPATNIWQLSTTCTAHLQNRVELEGITRQIIRNSSPTDPQTTDQR